MLDVPPVVEVYYASSCTPCRLELPALAHVAEAGSVPLAIIVLTDRARAEAELGAVSAKLLPLMRVAASAKSRAVLRAAGDADGILPYARAVRADGTVCGSWRGQLTEARIHALRAACG